VLKYNKTMKYHTQTRLNRYICAFSYKASNIRARRCYAHPQKAFMPFAAAKQSKSHLAAAAI
jgi:hypothetical protein